MDGSRIKSKSLLFGSHFSCGDIGDTDTDTQMGRAASIGLARSAPAPYWTLGIPYQWHVLFPSAQRDESESWLFPRISMLEQSCRWVGGSSSVTGTDHCRRVADHHVHKWPDVDQAVVGPPTTHCPPCECALLGIVGRPTTGLTCTPDTQCTDSVSLPILVLGSLKPNLVTNSAEGWKIIVCEEHGNLSIIRPVKQHDCNL